MPLESFICLFFTGPLAPSFSPGVNSSGLVKVLPPSRETQEYVRQSEIGLPYLKVIHLNDSKNGMKSHKDRHENLGYGQIGFNTLLKWAWHPLTNHVIKILETPAVNGIMPYKEEVSMIKNKKFDDWIKDEY